MTKVLCPKERKENEKENLIPLTSLPQILEQTNVIRKKRIILIGIPSKTTKVKCEKQKIKRSPTDVATVGSSSPLTPSILLYPPLSSDPVADESSTSEETDPYESAIEFEQEHHDELRDDPRCNTMAFISHH
jgi:hypothetical protein